MRWGESGGVVWVSHTFLRDKETSHVYPQFSLTLFKTYLSQIVTKRELKDISVLEDEPFHVLLITTK